MSRFLFLLLAGIYSAALAISMIFAPEAALQSYGAPTVDLIHISVMHYLGISNVAFTVLSLLNRNAPNSFSLRTILLAQSVNILTGVVLGIYQVYGLNTPHSSFFVVDSLLRLAWGLGFLYFYITETRQARTGVMMA